MSPPSASRAAAALNVKGGFLILVRHPQFSAQKRQPPVISCAVYTRFLCYARGLPAGSRRLFPSVHSLFAATLLVGWASFRPLCRPAARADHRRLKPAHCPNSLSLPPSWARLRRENRHLLITGAGHCGAWSLRGIDAHIQNIYVAPPFGPAHPTPLYSLERP
ncbi:hypothetical protein PWT90_05329 [Aphanocladium album]|nr:hypothetical protein PWT90_05329 [Aphanocladium album]